MITTSLQSNMNDFKMYEAGFCINGLFCHIGVKWNCISKSWLFLLCFPGLMEVLPDRCTTIAKKELVYAGTVGLICWLGGIVFINRKKTSDAKSTMAEAAKTMLDEQVIKPFSRSKPLYVDGFWWWFQFHHFPLFRSGCGSSQRERVTRKVTCCPSRKVLFTWQYRHKLVYIWMFLMPLMCSVSSLKNPKP